MRKRSQFLAVFRFRNVWWRAFKTPKGHFLYVPQHTFVPLYSPTRMTRREMTKALDGLPRTGLSIINQRAREEEL